MSSLDHHSSIRFTSPETLALLRASEAVTDEAAMVSLLFDRTKVSISETLDRGESTRSKIRDLSPSGWDALRASITHRIVDAMTHLGRVLDLRSNEWMNAPAAWELLSFDDEVLHSSYTPLPDALRDAKLQLEGLLSPDVDIEALMNDIDDVIHQTHGRRKAIQRVMDAALGMDIAGTTMLDTGSIPDTVIRSVQNQVRTELRTTDQVLTEAVAGAICHSSCNGNACEEVHGNFSIDSSEVTRVDAEEPRTSAIGDVYLVRSQNVASLGDHAIVIIGGLIEKPHGLRPADLSFPLAFGHLTPLDDYDIEEPLVLLKLSDAARLRFYEAYNVPEQYRRP